MSKDKHIEKTDDKAGQAAELPAWVEVVRRQVATLKYGTVQITIHDSRVIQIERLEKLRLDRPQH